MYWWLLILLLGLALGLWIHRLFEGECIPRDLLRELRLSRKTLHDWDRRWGNDPDKSDIVVSLTTIPSRMLMIDTTLKGLLDQSRPPKEIILNIPNWSDRENCAYEVPAHLEALHAVTVNRCKDWGPATKVIPTLSNALPDQAVVVVDDDRIYPKDFLERMERETQANPDVALTCAGWIVPADYIDRPTTIVSNLFKRPPAPMRGHRTSKRVEIDVLLGVFGYLIKPRFFDLEQMEDFSNTPRAGFLADDVRTSALCTVPKMVIPVSSLSHLPRRGRRHLKRTALANLNNGDGDLENRSNTKAIRHYAEHWRVGGHMLEKSVGKVEKW